MDTDPAQSNNINKANDFSDLSQPLSVANPTPAPQAPKKKKSLIVTILILIFILICSGGFAAFAIVKNQPDNVALSAMHKLFSSRNVTVTGNADISLPGTVNAYIGIESIHYDISAETSGVNYSTEVAIEVNLTDGTEITLPKIGELMLDNGIFYLKVDNLKNVYNSYRDQLSYYLNSIIESAYKDSIIDKCRQDANGLEEIYKCYDIDITISSTDDMATAKSIVDLVLAAVDDIIDYTDGKWLEISVEDILDDDLMSWIGDSNRDDILKVYNCVTDKFGNFDQYSSELSSLYDKHPFVSVAPTGDSFYDISLRSNELAGYINSVPNTKLFNDFASCSGNQAITSANVNISADQVQSAIEYLPNISAKIEGFLDHQLSELKISKKDTNFNFNSNFNFSYSKDINVVAPDTSTPIMELVHKIYDLVNGVQSEINNMF